MRRQLKGQGIPGASPVRHRWIGRAGAFAIGLAMVAALPASASPPVAAPRGADATAEADAALKAALDEILDDEFLADARVSVHVRDLARDRVLYDRGGADPLNPASNAKLITTAAALSLLGPEHRFATRLVAEDVSDGVVDGNLYLVGGGDPILTTGDLYELANQLHARGISKIKGGVVVDATRFDGDGLPPGFDQKYELATYRAPTGACSLNFNAYEVHVGPGKLGQKGHGAIDPPVPSIALVNETTTVAGDDYEVTVHVDATDDGYQVTLKGDIGVDARRGLYRYPVSNPSLYAGETLREMLRRLGIKVGRAKIGTGRAPSRTQTLATHRSETLSVIARGINKLSNNYMAEMVLHGLPQEDGASAAAGLEAVRRWWKDAGLPAEGLVYGNGSGLYDNNRVSAKQMVALLAHVHDDFRIRSDFVASLSIAGDDGTTRRRMRETEAEHWVRAKTGTLDGVSALSGYIGRPGRDPVAFSILFNDLGRWETGKARRAQDAVVVAIADSLAARERASRKNASK